MIFGDVQAVAIHVKSQARLGAHRVEALIASGEVTGGMVPKLRAAARAVVPRGTRSAAEVCIGAMPTFLRDARGTHIVAEI